MEGYPRTDDLYEEPLWHPDDELQFTHDGQRSSSLTKPWSKNNEIWIHP